MLWIPQKGRYKIISNDGIVGSANPGTALPGNATTLLDGAVTEIISAAQNIQDSWGIMIWVTNTGSPTVVAEACCDILIGGATDDVLIAALICGYCVAGTAASGGGRSYFFPLHIQRGVRIAATLASVRTSITARIVIRLFGGGTPPFKTGEKVTTYGTQINNARGQAVVPTASGGAASVTQMTAATTRNHFALIPGFQPATDGTITPTGYVNIGIGVGAATEERIGTWWFKKDTNEDMTGPEPGWPTFVDVPAGSRLTMLASNSGANDSAYDGLIYAVS